MTSSSSASVMEIAAARWTTAVVSSWLTRVTWGSSMESVSPSRTIWGSMPEPLKLAARSSSPLTSSRRASQTSGAMASKSLAAKASITALTAPSGVSAACTASDPPTVVSSVAIVAAMTRRERWFILDPSSIHMRAPVLVARVTPV